MVSPLIRSFSAACASVLLLTSCSGGGPGSFGSFGRNLFGGPARAESLDIDQTPINATAGTPPKAQRISVAPPQRRKWFQRQADPKSVAVANKYLWNATLDVIAFLPIQSADPLTGVISTGYGTAPGGRRAYRATVQIRDQTLDAQSLVLNLQTRGGRAASSEAKHALEDAIFTRARQLRIAESKP